MSDPQQQFADDLDVVLQDLRKLLIEKNRAYGDSALAPVNILAKGSPREGICWRIDDKLKRLMKGEAAGEDTERDLRGYLVLLAIADLRQKRVVDDALHAASDARKAYSVGQAHRIVDLSTYGGGGQGGGK